ncbi:MAG: hypothetical protein ACKO5Q_09760, partial [Microcystaceae cyanobacterium]
HIKKNRTSARCLQIVLVRIFRWAIALNIKLITRTTTIKQIGELRPISELITQGEGQGGVNPPVL